MTKEWTSGNKDIDDYIKEIQFKATEYEVVFEWIPVNKLDSIQKTSELTKLVGFLKEFEDHAQLKYIEYKVYGISKYITKGYKIVFDEFILKDIIIID
ncbi:hypothetical protein C2G38_2179329 [Gigaspora rosea]|uniref:Uncharacterized protein n=1 Tax=Gigaspora rosea TaxID=44941 RepID=A0A397VHE3_9GLOM|nr:hypothetical protein C2G38_2179329 [Gigaspora rosea]